MASGWGGGRGRPGRPPRREDAASPWPFVGMAGMAAVFFLYAASGPVTPWWGQALLLAFWALLLLVAAAWWSLHPTWVPWVPVVGFVVLFATVVAGAAWWGWAD
ncbi:hypothetical protein [Nocardioides kribbensis]|uniref:hypothetical protein n=1 Tax=Nocardioides kribbensis TaxID=305517 RepID=UPI0032D9E36E